MELSPPIHILEKDANKRGDIFTSLMKDLFVSLGYQEPRLNIHKTGRELDLKADHRFDGSGVIAECKATIDKPGGSDLNKFAGVLDLERRKSNGSLVNGYFISLYGFTQSGEEMERQFTPPRFVRLDADGVVNALIQGGRPITREEATEQAGRCVGNQPTLKLDRKLELIVHERGLYWAVCYRDGALRSHLVLVAADGTPARLSLAQEILATDRELNGPFHGLICLNPGARLSRFSSPQISAAKDAWKRHVAVECGTIQVEGISGDQHVLERRFQLEQLFIPQRLNIKEKKDKLRPTSISNALVDYPHLAILAPPGGGKSTLLKRLAVAYSDPARRTLAADKLPDYDWFPILFRCRELRNLASRPFGEILADLANRPHLYGHDDVFVTLAYEACNKGNALFLVDGLDEISDPSARTAFVCTLRAALDAWPKCRLIITSREAGFRHVAAHLSPFCSLANLSPFNKQDIHDLTDRWHTQIDGDTPVVKAAAKILADRITKNDRIRQLAINPLLLTTLFLVKRQTGDLPTGRAKLYAEAVKVLLWTWNIEGTTRIDPDDAIPRLAWIAFSMLVEGIQRISKPVLQKRLHEANGVLENTFGLRYLDPGEFIERVETRSSLLMMTGQDVEDGQLRDFYEFRHLTFQEYLSAVACVEGYHFGRQDSDTLASVLTPFLQKEKWREVIPLAAVMGSRETGALLSILSQYAAHEDAGEVSDDLDASAFGLLCQCLADEAPATPAILDEAIKAILIHGTALERLTCESQFWRSRFSGTIRKLALTTFLNASAPFVESGWTLASMAMCRASDRGNWNQCYSALLRAQSMLNGSEAIEGSETERQTVLEGAFLTTEIAYEFVKVDGSEISKWSNLISTALKGCSDALIRLLYSQDFPEQLAALMAYGWIFESGIVPSCLDKINSAAKNAGISAEDDIVGRILCLAFNGGTPDVQRYAKFALRDFPWVVEGKGIFGSTAPKTVVDRLMDLKTEKDSFSTITRLKLKMLWYFDRLYPDEFLLRRAQEVVRIGSPPDEVARDLRAYLLENKQMVDSLKREESAEIQFSSLDDTEFDER